MYNWISGLGTERTRGTISNNNSKLQTTIPRPRIPRLGIHSGHHIPRPDILCRTEMGKEDNDGVHQYLFFDWRYQCQLYTGSGS